MDDRLAGDVFGFGFPVEDKEESQSALAQYFPELQLYSKLGGKGARGGRLGRSSGGPAMQAFTAPVTKPQPTTQPTTQPTAQPTQQTNIGDLLNQSMQKFLDEWKKSQSTTDKTTPNEGDKTTKPVEDTRDLFQGQERVFKALNPNPQSPREAITALYESKLGRTPAESEIQSWLTNPVFEDKGLTAGEWEQLNRGFETSTEYLGLKRNTPGSTYTVPKGGLPARTQEPVSAPTPTPAPAPAPTPAPAPAPAPTRSFTPENPNPQTPEEAVKYLYQTQLGRTPSSSEVSSWTANPVFADRGLDKNEWSQLIAGFQSSPEYASVRR